MPGLPDASYLEDESTVPRFGRAFRLVHWAHAAPFLFLLLSGLTLFIPPLKALHVDGFRLLPLLHILVGLAFILSPIPLYLAIRHQPESHSDARWLFLFSSGDAAWARYALTAVLGGRARIPPTGKFNLGQKLNTYVTVVTTAALMLTGAILAVNFFTKRVFGSAFVEQVFPLHDLFMLIALPVVVAHIYLGSLHPGTRESFRAITRGRVKRSWAAIHHSEWLEELDSRRSGERGK